MEIRDADWLLPAKTYSGNRHTALTQIEKTNAAALRMAWRTDIADDGQEASPIIWNGTAERMRRLPRSRVRIDSRMNVAT
jgi:glucose dehydrogenase